MQWQAQWIWTASDERRPFNKVIVARKTFTLPSVASATLAITADTRYRVFINGIWVEDGPVRSYPAHFRYDVLDVGALLRPGCNVIAVVARHFGPSTFHVIPQEAGLLAQLTVTTADGAQIVIPTDESWRAIPHPGHIADTARVSIQMEAAEWHDARPVPANMLGGHFDDGGWPTAKAYHPAEGGPWADLQPRDVRFFTREALHPVALTAACVVDDQAFTQAIDLKRLCYPGDTSSNNVPLFVALATVLDAEQACETTVRTHGHWGEITFSLNGQPAPDGRLALRAGENLLVVKVATNYGHLLYDVTLAFSAWAGITARNPLPAAPSPWAAVGSLYTMDPVTNLENWNFPPAPAEILAQLDALAAAPDATAFLARGDARPVPTELLLHDCYPAFLHRRVLGSADALLSDRAALLADNHAWTTVRLASEGDVELCLDLGKEAVGWVEFELDAPAGTVVDAHLIEYRDGDRLQHTQANRNGFRYVTRAGVNHFVSLKRRAGRYIFLTLRGMTGPVKLRLVRLLQATYPVELRGAFTCSDAALNRIWEISAYTLRLCMEDTYTDCPLYEQTLWVGDARNEALYNAIVYGADDLTFRCLRVVAQSLDDFPMVGCQVPSGWNTLLSAWSFLWGINVWDYYFSSGDKAGLAELYPAVIANLRGAERYCTERGLFSANMWNLFDWAGIDDTPDTVIHNSLFLVGALDAALQCCAVLSEADSPWLQAFRARTVAAILPLWDAAKGSYPDSIHNDGTVSPSISQHTSALALLYGVLPDGAEAAARRNVLDPPEGMVRVGSPFALQYFLEALEGCGDAAHAVGLIRRLWQDMLDCGATTCWETFRGWDALYPTRSHCHAWSSAPVYVFNRLLLGIVPTGVAASEVVVSPHPLGLTYASGATASPRGPLRVAWTLQDDSLAITVDMPAGTAWRVEPNADWQGITRVTVNGEERPELLKMPAPI
jgi:hypothetical protein